jgi:hypothetical protein
MKNWFIKYFLSFHPVKPGGSRADVGTKIKFLLNHSNTSDSNRVEKLEKIFTGCKNNFINQTHFHFIYSGRHLMGSLWDREKLIPITD